MPKARRTHIAPLDCIVVDGGDQPRVLVVICHGYGASQDDLAPLAGEWMSMLGDSASQFRFVFPNAPHDLAEMGMPDARAWWPINMSKLAQAVQASKFDQLHDMTPPGIDQAREALCQTIAKCKEEFGDDTPCVIGGFSQGAMLAMDIALRGEITAPDALFLFSGTLVCKSKWKDQMSRLSDCEVFQSHGRVDPILPFTSAEALRDLMASRKIPVRFHSFMGPHTIDAESVEITGEILAGLATSK